MLWIILSIIVVIGTVLGVLWCRADDLLKNPRAGIRAVTSAGVALLAILLMAFSIKPVSAGEVGVVRQFGAITTQIGEGINFVAPWRTVDTVSVRTESARFEGLTAASSQTQDVFVDVTLNYSIAPGDVQGLVRNYGLAWFDVLVPPRINNFLKEETVKYETVDILPNRETIRRSVQERLRQDLEPLSITVSDLLIDNITFQEDFLLAIESKQIAEQDVEAERNRAQQARERAQGRADALVIEAEGQSEANDLIAQSLTPALIQWQAVEEFADDVSVVFIPSGQGVILDPTTMLTPDDDDDE